MEVKNLLEFKIGNRVLVEGNIFENIWPTAQAGFAIANYQLIEWNCPWTVTKDVTFRYNRM